MLLYNDRTCATSYGKLIIQMLSVNIFFRAIITRRHNMNSNTVLKKGSEYQFLGGRLNHFNKNVFAFDFHNTDGG